MKKIAIATACAIGLVTLASFCSYSLQRVTRGVLQDVPAEYRLKN